MVENLRCIPGIASLPLYAPPGAPGRSPETIPAAADKANQGSRGTAAAEPVTPGLLRLFVLLVAHEARRRPYAGPGERIGHFILQRHFPLLDGL